MDVEGRRMKTNLSIAALGILGNATSIGSFIALVQLPSNTQTVFIVLFSIGYISTLLMGFVASMAKGRSLVWGLLCSLPLGWIFLLALENRATKHPAALEALRYASGRLILLVMLTVIFVVIISLLFLGGQWISKEYKDWSEQRATQQRNEARLQERARLDSYVSRYSPDQVIYIVQAKYPVGYKRESTGQISQTPTSISAAYIDAMVWKVDISSPVGYHLERFGSYVWARTVYFYEGDGSLYTGYNSYNRTLTR